MACEILNLGAANSQWVSLEGSVTHLSGSTASNGSAGFTTGEGAVQVLGPGVATKPAHTLLEGACAASVDTTGGCPLVLSVINPTATATCETKLYGALVEIV